MLITFHDVPGHLDVKDGVLSLVCRICVVLAKSGVEAGIVGESMPTAGFAAGLHALKNDLWEQRLAEAQNYVCFLH